MRGSSIGVIQAQQVAAIVSDPVTLTAIAMIVSDLRRPASSLDRRNGVLARQHYRAMPTFNLQFPASEIEALASRFGYVDDTPLLALGAAARIRGYYTRQNFIDVCAWKTPRSRPRVASNSRHAVMSRTGRALAATDESERITPLLELLGVGVPTASTLLYFAFPEDYPILDVRALESLGVKARSQYPVSLWLKYLRACRELARRNEVSIRTLDKALWQYSKERAARAGADG